MKREYITLLVAERAKFDNNLMKDSTYSPICRANLFPTVDPNVKYYSIDLSTISGIFWIWIVFMEIGMVCLAVEHVHSKFHHKEDLTKSNFKLSSYTFVMKNAKQRDLILKTFDRLKEQLENMS